MIKQFDTFEVNDQKFEDIKQSVVALSARFSEALENYKDLLLDSKRYSFEFKEVEIKNNFGCFKEVVKVMFFSYSF